MSDFTHYEVKYAWETAMRNIELSSDTNPLSTLIPQARGHLDAAERALKRAWDAFEESDWDEAARQSLRIQEEINDARSRLLDIHHAQGDGSSVSPPPAHSDKPAP